MGSMALQLKPFTAPDPIETYGRAMSLRALMDERRYRALREQQAQQKILEDQEERQQTQNLRQLFSTNPNPTMQQILSVAPGNAGIRAATEFRQAQTAEETRKTAELTRQKTFRDVQQGFREEYLNAVTAIARDKDPARRAAIYPQIQQRLRQAAGEYLTPDLDAFISQELPDDEDEILTVYAAVKGPEALEKLLKDRAAETRAKAEEARKVAEEERKKIKAPLEERKLTAETTQAEQQAAGTVPETTHQRLTREQGTGELRTFKEFFYPRWLASKGITTPKASDEITAWQEYRTQPYVPLPGRDFPKSDAVINAEIDEAKRKAAALATDKPQSAEAAKVTAIAQSMIPELQQLKESLRKGGRLAMAGILSGTDARLRRLAENAADKVGRLRSGGAVNPNEEARFMGQIARFTDVATGDMGPALAAIDSLIDEANIVLRGVGKASPAAPAVTAPSPARNRPPLSSFER